MTQTSRDVSRLRLSRTLLIVLISALVLAKVVLAVVTPASVDVYSYLQLATRKDPTFSSSPWTYLYNGTLAAWMMLPIAHPPVERIWSSPSILMSPSLHLLVFMTKLPMLVADLAVALVLHLLGRRLFPGSKAAWYVALVWLANPYVTFVNEMMAATDIIPTFATVLAIYLLYARKYLFGILSMAAAIITKLFPVFFVPGFVYLARSNKVRSTKLIVYIVVGFLAFLAYAFWALLGKNIVFLNLENPITQSITEFVLVRQSGSLAYNYGAGDFLGIATFCLVLAYLVIFEFRPSRFTDPVRLVLLVFLVYLAFLDIQFQFVIWVVPFLTIEHFRDMRTTVPGALIYVSSFLFGFSRDGFQTYSPYTLFFLRLASPSNWFEKSVDAYVKSPLTGIVAMPLLRTAQAAFMIVIMLLLVFPHRAETV
jgi:hypothetical protein